MVRLTEDEAWAEIGSAHTGILTTLRRDGTPIALPVWFVVQDRTIAMRTPVGAKKIVRVRNDPRASFLVESGERWADLRAVHLTGSVEVVADEEAGLRINDELNAKYAAFAAPSADLPAATKKHYARSAFLRFVPEERILTWDNARLLARMAERAAQQDS